MTKSGQLTKEYILEGNLMNQPGGTIPVQTIL